MIRILAISISLNIVTLGLLVNLNNKINAITAIRSGQMSELLIKVTTNMDDRFRGREASREFDRVHESLDALNQSLIRIDKRVSDKLMTDK